MERKNFHFWLNERQLNDKKCIKFQRSMQMNDNLISRLGLEKELEGHTGCVNCLEWNEKGDLLMSGSDDVQIIIWNPFTHKKLKAIQSGHHGNIFSVKFLPNTNDNTIISGAADSKVRVHEVNSSETTMVCCCHLGRVKRLAVAPNVPFLFWSAAEDGMILQYDLRQPHQCSNMCNNVLINLVAHTGPNAEAKCLAINPMRPELIAIGANDAFVRIYDRRMITPSTIKHRGDYSGSRYSWDRQMSNHSQDESDDNSQLNSLNLSPACAKYFVAGHLPRRMDYRKRFRSYASTYLAFSPDGSELLANLGGEQIYLFDVLRPNVPKSFDINMHKNGYHKDVPSSSSHHPNGYLNGTTNGVTIPYHVNRKCFKKMLTVKTQLPQTVDYLKCKANEKFDLNQYTFAIDLYNKAIAMCPNAAVLYGNRSAAFMKRNWDGDLYAALRDCHTALSIDIDYLKAHFRLSRCLYELHWYKEAYECLQEFKSKFPDHIHTQSFESLDKEIQQAMFSNKSESSKKEPSNDTNGDGEESKVSQSQSSESVSGNNSSPQRSRSGRSNHRHASSSTGNASSLLSNQEKEWRSLSYDYKSRFCGHCNTTTDIKEANFFGSHCQYIVAGSDDGSFFVWDKETTNIVRVLRGDDSIVNCLQPHPSTCLLATSGIDPVVRLWSPRPEDGKKDDREIENSEDAAVANQRRMNADPLEVMLMNMGYRIPGVFEPDDDDDHVVQCRPS